MDQGNNDIRKDFLLLGGFLDYLLANGFEFGPDKYIVAKQLANALDPHVPKEKFKRILCPLFAYNAEKQAQFYYLFDRYFESAAIKEQPETAIKDEKENIKLPQRPQKRKYMLAGLLAFAIIVSIILLVNYLSNPSIAEEANPDTVVEENPVIANEKTDASGPSISSIDTIKAIISRPVDAPAQDMEIPVAISLWPPIGEDVSDLIYRPTWWERYGLYVKLGAVLLFLIVFIAVQVFKHQKKKFLLLQQQFKKPPDKHPLDIPNPKFALFHSDSFFNAAKTLRERDISEHFEIDFPKTIQSTVDAGGFLQLRHNPLTKPSEYLVLVDIKDGKDHQGQWMKQLAKELQRQDVLFEIFFYNTDPRIVWRYNSEEWHYLEDLFFQSRDYRLIIFGDGEMLLDGFTGRLKGWTELIRDWEDRVLCTPVPVNHWSRREVALETLLKVLPATTQGLAQLNIALESQTLQPEPQKRLMQFRSSGWSAQLPDFETDLTTESHQLRFIKELEQCLGKHSFEWVCACAVYPELHWDFTLELGRRLSTKENDLLTPKNLYYLSCIPWFRHGAIPGAIRTHLSSLLPAHTKTLVLETIIEVLNLNPPPENTYAYNQYRMHLVLAELQLTKETKRKKQLQKEVRELSFGDPEAKELATLQYASALDSGENKIPASIKNVIYDNGFPVLGLDPQFSNLLAGFALLFAFLFIFITRQQLQVAAFNNQLYLLNNSLDSCRYFTFRALNGSDFDERLDFYNQALDCKNDFAQAYLNRALLYQQVDSIGPASNDFGKAHLIADTASSRNPQFITGPDKSYSYKDSIIKSSLYDLGAMQYGKEQYGLATISFTQLIKRYDKNNFEYERGLSLLYNTEDKLDSAITEFNTVWSRDSNFYKMPADTLYHPVVRPLVVRYQKITDPVIKNKIRNFLQKLHKSFADLLKDKEPPPNPKPPTPIRPSSGRISRMRTDTIAIVAPVNKPSPSPPAKYELQDRPISEGLAAVKNEAGLWGFINSKGVLVIDFKYDEVTEFKNGNAQVMQGKTVFYINKSGSCIKDCPDK